MTPQELRIGNWIERGGVCVTVDERTIFDFSTYAYQYEPIPVSRLWLEKFGFKKETDDFLISRYNNQYETHVIYNYWDKDRDKKTSVHFVLSTYGGHYSITYYNREDLIRELDYVHQLQNLYYAINDKDL